MDLLLSTRFAHAPEALSRLNVTEDCSLEQGTSSGCRSAGLVKLSSHVFGDHIMGWTQDEDIVGVGCQHPFRVATSRQNQENGARNLGSACLSLKSKGGARNGANK